MKVFILIALVGVLGSAIVEGRGPPRGPPGPRGPRGPPPPGPRWLRGPHGPRGSPWPDPPPHYKENRRPPWLDSSESGSSGSSSYESGPDSGPDSGPGSGSDSSGYEPYNDWSDWRPRPWPCKGKRCPSKNTPPTTTTTTTTPRPINTPGKVPWWVTPSSTTKSSIITPNWWDIITPSTSKSTSPSTRPATPSTSIATGWIITTKSTPTIATSSPVTPTPTTDQDTCIQNCASTPEYNPVCGTDGKTYNNIGKLECAKQCGVAVELRRTSACPPSVSTSGTSAAPRFTTSTTTEPSVRATPTSKYLRCMKDCPITPDISPVCGTDGLTYMNMDRLKCAQSCGNEIQVLCNKACAACVKGPKTTASTTTTTTASTPVDQTTGGDISRTTPWVSMEQCIRRCPSTSEKFPVCGTNGVTYSNPGHLLCAQFCGNDVRVARMSSCEDDTTTTTEVPTTPPTLTPEIANCMKHCPVTSEYNPLCGTDGRTYTNPGRLQCAQFCGLDVDVKLKKTCPSGDDTTTAATTLEAKKEPESTWSPTTLSSTTTSTTTTTTTTTTRKPSTGGRTRPTSKPTVTMDFSLPPDILASIFSDETIESGTEPTTNDNFSLDPRFGNSLEENESHEEIGENKIVFRE